MKGYRTPPDNRKERLKNIEAMLANMQQALNISQLFAKHMANKTQKLEEDLNKALGIINELQYKTLSIQTAANLDTVKLNDIANTLRLKDFSEASDKEDAEVGFVPAEVVGEDSTVIMTSKTFGTEDKGIFRSRMPLAELGVPELISGFMGQAVGTKVRAKLNGEEHEIELLAIRNPVQKETPVETQFSTQTQGNA